MDGIPEPDAPPSVRALLDKYGLHARKGLGQHFLADPNILRNIVAAAELTTEDTVLEVGPGLGTLTRWLAQAAGRVFAVELDQAMVALLQEELAHLSNLEIVQGDILQLDPATLIGSAPVDSESGKETSATSSYIVVANLPYYITSAAIRHLLEAKPAPHRLVLMIQREVAQRIVAKPGDMSLLSVSVQFYGHPRIVAKIPPGAFVPPPKVDSAVIRIDTYETPPVQVPDAEAFFRVARAGFSQKRKQLKNTLSSGLHLPADEVVAAMTRAGVDPRRRAQTLSLEEWNRLTAELS